MRNHASEAAARMQQAPSQTNVQNAEATCDGSRGALCSSQDPNNCDRARDCPAFSRTGPAIGDTRESLRAARLL